MNFDLHNRILAMRAQKLRSSRECEWGRSYGGCSDGSREALAGSLVGRDPLQEAVSTTQVRVQRVRRLRVRRSFPSGSGRGQGYLQNDVSVWSRDVSGFPASVQQMGADRPSESMMIHSDCMQCSVVLG